MESKYQVVSIKENPFQRAGDVTFRGPSPSFAITDFSFFFLCSFLSPTLPHFFPSLLSFFLVLRFSGKRILHFLKIGSEFLLWTRPRLSRGSELGSSLDHPLWPFPLEPARQPSLMSVHRLEPGQAESREGKTIRQGSFLLNLAWFASSWFICGNERGVAASSPDSPARAILRRTVNGEKIDPLSSHLCFIFSLWKTCFYPCLQGRSVAYLHFCLS